jgi:hypothetical protein
MHVENNTVAPFHMHVENNTVAPFHMHVENKAPDTYLKDDLCKKRTRLYKMFYFASWLV